MYSHICKTCGKNFITQVKTSKYCSRECKNKGKGRTLDLTGRKFGKLTALYLKEKKSDNEKNRWVCKCDCGNISYVQTSNLVRGITVSCGCIRKGLLKPRGQMKETDFSLLHKRRNMLEVIGFSGYKLICKCDCGNTIEIFPSQFLNDHTKSCGCLKRKNSSKIMKKVSQDIFRDHTNIARISSPSLSKNNSTGVKGVFKNKKGKYIATIGIQNKKIYLGCYSSLIKATQARKEAEEKYFKPIIDKYKKKGRLA